MRVVGARLCLTFQVENPDRQPLPLHFGLHPYFRVSLAHKAEARVETEATQAWDARSRTRDRGRDAGGALVRPTAAVR